MCLCNRGVMHVKRKRCAGLPMCEARKGCMNHSDAIEFGWTGQRSVLSYNGKVHYKNRQSRMLLSVSLNSQDSGSPLTELREHEKDKYGEN